ncbi:hypothetical protein QR680_005008 [Steinernema hermaphroditum]|uniref:Uncharacterized protein n=1 Tax=Steinernema hermaphroditum TaxID=289476 RepID=A0AA39HQJ1_9BILA|nr:hypothetical protein QR680_005008 [Steinernema hermaphroditum]
MGGIYLPLARFIMMANQLSANLSLQDASSQGQFLLPTFEASGSRFIDTSNAISHLKRSPGGDERASGENAMRTVAVCRLLPLLILPLLDAYRKGTALRGPPKKAASDADEQREFVRTSWADDDPRHTFKKKTYSTLPRELECFSCMSLSYQDNWQHLQSTYHPPKVFTNRCNDPLLQKNIPTTLCGTVCVSLLEPEVEAGVFIGYKYIRGCLDRLLLNGFNQTALRTHRFSQMDTCRSLPRAHLFNPVRGMNQPMYGEVQLCSCYGDKCNGAASSAPLSARWSPLTVFVLLALSWMLT